eukprot:TRINITY_DN2781_c0_g1_i1.p1 TRINITY_DN2781_c0_g1~~TRINITY_DN2781_c0_g1_i1.p1  ORF type:complete len:360 (+),score=139.52 TRINITY_DN2781_c0_g1_i1:72-1151(+)
MGRRRKRGSGAAVAAAAGAAPQPEPAQPKEQGGAAEGAAPRKGSAAANAGAKPQRAGRKRARSAETAARKGGTDGVAGDQPKGGEGQDAAGQQPQKKRRRKAKPAPAALPPPPPPPPPTAFTAKQGRKEQSTLGRLSAQLRGGKFRWINEKLYTTSSGEAVDMFEEDPSLFDDYHSGFREQVARWPKNPLFVIADSIVASKPARQQRPFVVVDLGCGEGQLASLLARTKAQTYSFDLVSRSPHITTCDVCKEVPMPNNCADFVVLCLALMGTNWHGALREAHRMLRPGGKLKVAEVTSRLAGGGAPFAAVLEKVGFSVLTSSGSHFSLFEATRQPGVAGRPSPGFDPASVLSPCMYRKR